MSLRGRFRREFQSEIAVHLVSVRHVIFYKDAIVIMAAAFASEVMIASTVFINLKKEGTTSSD